MHTTILKTFILHKKVHILCSTSYELNKNVSKTVKMNRNSSTNSFSVQIFTILINAALNSIC